MIIAGVDPGSRVTGYGIIKVTGNHFQCLDYGAISTTGRGDPSDLKDRLLKIFNALSEVLTKYTPEYLVVESVFYARNVHSSLLLGHVRGIILLAAAQANLPVVEYSPLEVKKAVTGYGRAGKEQVQAMVKTLLNLESVPQPHDASDALALALCQGFGGARSSKRGTRWSESDLKQILGRDPC